VPPPGADLGTLDGGRDLGPDAGGGDAGNVCATDADCDDDVFIRRRSAAQTYTRRASIA